MYGRMHQKIKGQSDIRNFSPVLRHILKNVLTSLTEFLVPSPVSQFSNQFKPKVHNA